MKKIKITPSYLLITLFSFMAFFASAQSYTVSGIVKDSESGKGIEFATVSLYSTVDSSLVGGVITELDGKFETDLTSLPAYAVVEYLSFETKIIDLRIPEAGSKIEMGEILLSASAVGLEEVTILGEKSTNTFNLDKRVFNVGSDLGSQGGTAQDLLNNVPSISVDLEGNVSLRGSGGVRIFINGRPSSLTGISGAGGLASIGANQIERVEVITNPSARYEAEGMTGIINIVLKKDSNLGFNGTFEVSGGLPEQQGLGTSLNYRKGAVNFFLNYNIRRTTRPGGSFNYLERYNGDTTSVLSTVSDRNRTGISNSVRSGLEFYLPGNQTLTTAFSFNHSDQENITNLTYREALFTGPVNRAAVENMTSFNRRTDTETETSPRYEVSLDYRKEFAEKGRELSALFQYQTSNELEESIFREISFENNIEQDVFLNQRSSNNELERTIQFQTDYIHPISEETTFETGLRGTIRQIGTDYVVEQLEDGSWMSLEGLTNQFEYDENVMAAYGIFSQKVNKFNYQLGLRYEYSNVVTELKSTNFVNERNYGNLFPSAFLNYELVNDNQIQVSFSRRINRPRFRELNPFFSFSDRINFFTGNPNLNPEFTNSYEIGHLKYWDNANFATSVYFRRTEDRTTRIKSINSDGTTLTQPMNLGFEDNLGIELLGSYSGVDWMRVDGETNFFNSRFFGAELREDLKANSWVVRGRLNTRFYFMNKTELQLRTNFQGPQRMPQGLRKANTTLDIGLGKELFNQRVSVAINARDVFNQRKYIYEQYGPDFYEDGENQWMRNSVMATIIYKINAQAQKKKPNQRNSEGNDYDMGGDGMF